MQQELESIEQYYELEQVIGRGSFGEVLRAVDKRTQQLVAVKRLVGARHDPHKYERFQREALLLSQVESDHVVRYLAHGLDREHTPWLVLEWLEGEDLAKRQQRAPMATGEVVSFAKQALSGLQALHQLGIVHRDIKPSNFFLVGDSASPKVKLIDLGIARAVTGLSVTLDGFRVGTPSYMSPEQARGDETIGPRSDLFSMGVVLYELLAGTKPFRAADPHALLAKIVLQHAPSLKSVVGVSVPTELAEIVAQLLEKYPENRFASAQDVLEALPNEWTVSSKSVPPMSLDPDSVATAELSSAGLSTFAEQRVISALFADYSLASLSADRAAFEEAVAQQNGTLHRMIGGRAVGVFGLSHSTGTEVLRAGHAALAAARAGTHLQLALVIGRVTTDRSELLSSDAIERGMATLACLPPDKSLPKIAVDAASARLLTAQFVLTHDADGTSFLHAERRADDSVVRFAGSSSTTIGREREINTLVSLAQECANESIARATIVVGAPGVGKTRIRIEAVSRVQSAVPAVFTLVAHGDAVSSSSPYAMLGNALLTASGAIEAQSALDRAHCVKQWIESSVQTAEHASRITGFFLAMCNIRLDDAALQQLCGTDFFTQWTVARRDPVVLGDCLRSAWLEWLAAVSQQRLVLCVVENLQWADRPTLALLDATLRTLKESPICLFAFSRPEIQEMLPSLWSDRSAEQLRVAPLPRRSAEKLLRTLVGEGYAFEEKVLALADGNPFFIEEILRSLAAGGSVDALPDTVAGMVQVQLDTLDAAERRVLRVVSVFGQSFWRGGAVALLSAGVSDSTISGAIRSWLSELERRDLITRKPTSVIAHEDEYVFRHAIVRDVAYSMLTEDDRINAHRRAGTWLESVGFLDDQVLAAHYAQGIAPHRATVFFAKAAARAMAGDDFRSALLNAQKSQAQAELHEQTISSDFKDGSPFSEVGFARFDALIIEAEAHRWQGNLEGCLAAAAQAIDIAPKGTRRWFRAMGEVASALARTGRYDAMDELAEQWLAIEPNTDAIAVAVESGGRLAAQLIATSRLARGRDVLERLARHEAKHGPFEALTEARLCQGRAQLALHEGTQSQYLRWITRTMDFFSRAGDKRNACVQGANVGNALLHLGAYQRAVATLTPLLQVSDRLGLRTGLAFVKSTLGITTVRLGDARTGLALQQEAATIFSTQGDLRMSAFCRGYIAEAHFALGEMALAEQIAREALEKFAVVRTTRAFVLAVLSRILFAIGALDEALALSKEGFEILSDPSVAIEEGEMLLRVVYGQCLEAKSHHSEALQVYQYTNELIRTRAGEITEEDLRNCYLAIAEHQDAIRLLAALESRLSSR